MLEQCSVILVMLVDGVITSFCGFAGADCWVETHVCFTKGNGGRPPRYGHTQVHIFFADLLAHDVPGVVLTVLG